MSIRKILAKRLSILVLTSLIFLGFGISAHAASISGTVANSSGPITGMVGQIQVHAFLGYPCDWTQLKGSAPIDTNGDYTIPGLSAGDYYLKTDNLNLSDYINEWWTGAVDPSSYDCKDAQPITVSGEEIGKDFELEQGGTVSGLVLNYSGVPQANVMVNYGNYAIGYWTDTLTDAGGQFQLVGIPDGAFEMTIEPDVATGLAWFTRYSYLSSGEDKDLGTIRLQKGALVTGHIYYDGAPLPVVEFWYGGRFEMGWGKTDTNGYFELRLPVGSYALNLDEDTGYFMVPAEIDVTDVNATYDLDNGRPYRLAYASNGERIEGAVFDMGTAPYGEFGVMVFLNDQEFTPDNAGGIAPLGFGMPDAGIYGLWVPPAADYDRSNRDVQVALALISNGPDDTESITIVDVVQDQGTPAVGVDGVDLSYLSAGQTVDGYVKDHATEEGVYYSYVILYSQPGDAFAGFAETDHTGHFVFYNVPAGTYRLAVTAPDYTNTQWSSNFDVTSSDIIVPDFFMSAGMDELAVDFGGSGLFHYSSTSWSNLSIWDSESMVAWTNGTAIDFGAGKGLFSYDGSSWKRLTSLDVEQSVAGLNGLVVDFGSLGLFYYNGTSWANLSTWDCETMVAWKNGIAIDFGAGKGLFNYNGSSWSRLSTLDVDQMIAGLNGLIVDFGSLGLFYYNGTSWAKLSIWDCETMAEWNNGIAIDFGAGKGLFNYNGSSWSRLSTFDADSTAAGLNGLVVDFGSLGLFYYNGTSWAKLSIWDCETVVEWSSGVAIDFGAGKGLFNYSGSSWSNLSSMDAQDTEAVDLD